MTIPKHHNPGSVPQADRQPGEVRARWAFAEATVWTERMLSALEQGVKGGKWFSLIDKVWSPKNLSSSFAAVAQKRGAAGVDHVTVDEFARRRDTELPRLEQALRQQTYKPQAVRRTWIPKPGSTEKRPLGVPTVRDRVTQTAISHVLEPIFERDFAEHSYGFRPGRGCKDALRRVDKLLKAGYTYVVDADLKSYFDTIPHDGLMRRIKQKVADGRVLTLIEQFLKQGVMDHLSEWTPTGGTPQGAVISPLLANVYLDPLDHLLAGQGFEMVRYADDFVILCRSQEEAEQALATVQSWVTDNSLTLHPTKTQVVTEAEGFEFLGYRFEAGNRWPRDKSMKKLKDTIRLKTRRTHGQSLAMIIANLNRTLRGWFNYFKHCHRYVFTGLDGWIRMRLRSILRQRQGRRGRGRGPDHQRYPNAYFAQRGLFSLAAAHAAARQSSSR